ncbi:ATP-grasp domain-containing protein [Lysobacter brunescens]|uniref:Acetyl-CoA carboxylase biotin carboxylase subunit family protein n=1 Tax=Lysobacter brunescens TaxID=262323 RepID=A0A6B7LID5_9GAMM|nr:putative kynureninase [Lysobacter brunescens]
METNRKGQDYCLILGSEKFRDRSLLGAVRATDMPVAVMYPNATINGHAFADLTINGNHCHPKEALAAIERFRARTGAKPRAIVPLIEMCMEAGLEIARTYGLPYLSEATIGRARNKYEMRKAFEAAGLPVPRYMPFTTLEELETHAPQLGFPVVVKPRNAGGSEGVMLVREQSELGAAYAHLRQAMSGYQQRHGLDESLFLVEEYIDAPHEVSVTLATSKRGVVALTVDDKYLGAKPYFVEMGHSMPSVFNKSRVIRETAEAACRALGVDRGVVEVEMKVYDENRVVLMELNARPPGDGTFDMIESTSGINAFEMHTKSYLRDDYEPHGIELRGRAAISFMNAAAGVVEQVNLPATETLPDCVQTIYTWRKPGDLIVRSHDSNSRDGCVQFYWPDDPVDGFLSEHLQIAASLSQQIYKVAPR